jgi:hypothetical protein
MEMESHTYVFARLAGSFTEREGLLARQEVTKGTKLTNFTNFTNGFCT